MQQGMLRSNMPECEDMFGFGFGSGWEMDFYSTSFCLIRLGFLLGSWITIRYYYYYHELRCGVVSSI